MLFLFDLILGLGLNDDGSAIKVSSGLVGQEQAREAAGLVVDLIRVGYIVYILFTIITKYYKTFTYLSININMI